MFTEDRSMRLCWTSDCKSIGMPNSVRKEKTMKAVIVICLTVLCPISAFAGIIFGRLSENRQPVKGAVITVTCGSDTSQTQTSDDGAYSLRANGAGRCTLSVKYKDQTVETGVFSYNQPTRYDFELVMIAGKYTLNKKAK